MFNLKTLVRPNILALKPYSSARDEFKGSEGVFLDANENPFGTLNRYPDSYHKELKTVLSTNNNIPVENIFTGNGSDEIIDLLYRVFCNPGKDKTLTFTPTFGMYQVAADINDVELIKLPLHDDFQINTEALKPYLSAENVKLIFICSPNNPTGNCFQEEDVAFILNNFNGIVVIDEAYIDFSSTDSFAKYLENYPNLIVMQTLSKAWSLAAARIGIAFASQDIIQLLNNVKMPYNVSKLNQKAAVEALKDTKTFEANKKVILEQKTKLKSALKGLDIVKKIYPSDANFWLIEVEDANGLYEELVAQKVITRNRNSLVKNSIRITVGTPAENEILIKALLAISKS
ncbi:histidinol-phosphate transaminase [Lacinutrix sp. C3R15]|uniref:histidinol-phosphate transaminase n=1 Tax=Flavobacteriaceae TaxID=49546 RepID=UPI001C08D6DB|nr:MULTISPECIES: histidinol-phosphate transaminase [Flavobacteriaceae]MBU2939958.1 histidinol-phosphate transaminase [Lacinutrix sp. C3R15]MDO6623275.1 histidinol-phosphate transaminase [Oceanihabitans sp. 1_MG-2023]